MLKFLLNLFLLYIVINLMGCSAQQLYTLAIDYERSSANLEIKSIELDYGTISYLENNVKSDTTIVLLHGFGGDKDNWNRFSAELDKNKHIIALDLPGHGESISNKGLDYSIAHQSIMLDKFLVAKKINNIHIVGNSMGGAIAIHYSDSYPQKIKSLTLIDAMGTIRSKSDLDSLVQKSGKNPLLNVCTEEEFDKLMHTGMQNPPYIPGIFMEIIVSKKCARADIEKIIYYEMLQETDLSEMIKKIKIPTLIIWGKKDSIFHVANASLFYNAIKNSQLVVFEESGHVPLLEEPSRTAQTIEKFIKKI